MRTSFSVVYSKIFNAINRQARLDAMRKINGGFYYVKRCFNEATT